MRKFTIIGLGALSTMALAFGAASPASAVIAPPGSITDQVCDAVPGGLAGVLNLQVANSILSGLLSTDMANNQADLTAKTTDLVNAIVVHIQTVDGGGNTVATGNVVSARASAYADSAAEWTKDLKAAQAAGIESLVLGMQQGVLSGIGSGLGCGIV